ncbi:hypothetical protein H7U32_10490 [Bifidobacterium pullorum subsp. saeculare]|uniref:Uncharacterized protein n=1 Tax=Bifidobacterium pullorum subsp. saeculare TaxID=78257 RepID=A0A938WZD5_9BIFI|nr:hypothetical protein [Bifidobacterium pullorum]MBM6700696.1 hypothetical protein [Bifidobacterium pullorum subsp. saeculare]
MITAKEIANTLDGILTYNGFDERIDNIQDASEALENLFKHETARLEAELTATKLELVESKKKVRDLAIEGLGKIIKGVYPAGGAKGQ